MYSITIHCDRCEKPFEGTYRVSGRPTVDRLAEAAGWVKESTPSNKVFHYCPTCVKRRERVKVEQATANP